MRSKSPIPLPVDEVTAELAAKLQARGAVVLDAPTGAGKSTRVPRVLLQQANRKKSQIVVLEPRRLAARLAAEYVAAEFGEKVGGSVGYTVRFDDKTSRKTQLRFMTSGVLMRQLAQNPALDGIGTLIFDEFHERHLADELLLSWANQLRRTARPDLQLVVMSATIDPESIASYLGAEIVRSEGKRFPVDMDYDDRIDKRPLSTRVAAALRREVNRGLDGDVLTFLPGLWSIERCRSACSELAAEASLELVPLHASLSPKEMRAALARRPASVRKILLSTNVAESSVTLDGVTVVIDSGIHKVAINAPWTGITSLQEMPIPRDSGQQRAGRAGRTAPGRCVRLYTEADWRNREFTLAPEIQRLDLAPLTLTLAALGVPDPKALEWLDPPEPMRWVAAKQLLRSLGAVDGSGGITPLGRELDALPLHPRLGRLLMRCKEMGAAEIGALGAALLSEDVRLPRDAPDNESDLLALVDLFHNGNLPRHTHRRVQAVWNDLGGGIQKTRLGRTAKVSPPSEEEREALQRSLLFAFSDRIAQRKGQSPGQLVLSGGGTAWLQRESVVGHAKWLVILNATGGRKRVVRMASAIDPEWLLDLADIDQDLEDVTNAFWDEEKETVRVTSTVRWRGLILDEQPLSPRGVPEAVALLAKRAQAAGVGRFADRDKLIEYLNRRRFAHQVDPTLPDLSAQEVMDRLRAISAECISFREIKQADLFTQVQSELSWELKQRLETLAPLRVDLPSGRWAKVRYPSEGPPRISSQVQHFLGMQDGPKLGGGKVPVLIELLAPNQRPVQLTDDLRGFWERTWPQVRKELRGRYPKHAWPENPLLPPKSR